MYLHTAILNDTFLYFFEHILYIIKAPHDDDDNKYTRCAASPKVPTHALYAFTYCAAG